MTRQEALILQKVHQSSSDTDLRCVLSFLLTTYHLKVSAEPLAIAASKMHREVLGDSDHKDLLGGN